MMRRASERFTVSTAVGMGSPVAIGDDGQEAEYSILNIEM
jgi:hypothetical protein